MCRVVSGSRGQIDCICAEVALITLHHSPNCVHSKFKWSFTLVYQNRASADRVMEMTSFNTTPNAITRRDLNTLLYTKNMIQRWHETPKYCFHR